MNFEELPSDEIAEFIQSSTAPESTPETSALARRVLIEALSEPELSGKVWRLRDVHAQWETIEGQIMEPTPEEAAHGAVLQARLQKAVLESAGFSSAESDAAMASAAPGKVRASASSTWVESAAHELRNVWATGGGRWGANTAQSARDLLDAIRQAGRGLSPVVLGGSHVIDLPCLAPALAAPASDAANLALLTGKLPSETVTSADGVRIVFQQLQMNPNRLRVLVDTSHISTPAEADSQNTELSHGAAYNVAFLTLMEGDATESASPGHNRHVLVVALNERGVGYADFSISSSGDSQKVFPAPRASGCRLVAATLSYIP